MFAATTAWSELAFLLRIATHRALAERIAVTGHSQDNFPHVVASVAGVSQEILKENTVRAQV